MLKSAKIPNRLSLFALGGLLFLGVLMQAGQASALKPHIRDGWLVGVSYGYTQGHIEWANESKGSYQGGALPQMRFARMISRSVALGVEYHGWMLEKGVVPLKLRSSLQSFTLAATWYPGQPGSALEGFYLRGGAGYGWAGLTFVEIDEEPQDHVPLDQEHGTRFDESGLAINFQLGYEFRLSKSFATGLGVGFDHLSINEEIYKSSYNFPITLTGAWYWD
jgi:hypothetical protein